MSKRDPDGLNTNRADWAEQALAEFSRITGLDFIEPDAPERVEAVTDLLADLMHWCDGEGLDFEHVLLNARHHYAAETGKGE
jgi:hypothetical protein